MAFQDRGQLTCVATDGNGNYSRSLDLEVKVSVDLMLCSGLYVPFNLFPGAEHNSVSCLYRRLFCYSKLEHVSVSRQRLHSSGGTEFSSHKFKMLNGIECKCNANGLLDITIHCLNLSFYCCGKCQARPAMMCIADCSDCFTSIVKMTFQPSLQSCAIIRG